MNPAADRVYSSTKEARDKKVLARDSDQSFIRCAFKNRYLTIIWNRFSKEGFSPFLNVTFNLQILWSVGAETLNVFPSSKWKTPQFRSHSKLKCLVTRQWETGLIHPFFSPKVSSLHCTERKCNIHWNVNKFCYCLTTG